MLAAFVIFVALLVYSSGVRDQWGRTTRRLGARPALRVVDGTVGTMSAPVAKYHNPVAQRADYETPPALFAEWDARFHFTLDAAATSENAKCARYFTPDDDGLAQDWACETVWVNPPYGRAIKRWVRKGLMASMRGATVVMLIPARTDSGWWHDYVMQGEITFLRGRIRFVGMEHNAPFPCAIVVFRPAQMRRVA